MTIQLFFLWGIYRIRMIGVSLIFGVVAVVLYFISFANI